MEELLGANVAQGAAETDPRDTEIRDLLLIIVQALVDQPGQVELLHVAGDGGMAFQVRAAAADVGKLIGKNGRTARAVRTIVGAAAARTGRRYSLDIVHNI